MIEFQGTALEHQSLHQCSLLSTSVLSSPSPTACQRHIFFPLGTLVYNAVTDRVSCISSYHLLEHCPSPECPSLSTIVMVVRSRPNSLFPKQQTSYLGGRRPLLGITHQSHQDLQPSPFSRVDIHLNVVWPEITGAYNLADLPGANSGGAGSSWMNMCISVSGIELIPYSELQLLE